MTSSSTQDTPRRATNAKAAFSRLIFFLYIICVCAALYIGWRLKPLELVDAEHGVGYWLGIAGGVAFLFLLIYPLRKRIKGLRQMGSVKSWFRLHMILGIVAPVLILFHANFGLGSLNSNVALTCMLIVATSGLLGRYAYAKIHRGLYGSKSSLRELQRTVTSLGAAMPHTDALIDEIILESDGEVLSLGQGFGRRRRIIKRSRQLLRAAKKERPDRQAMRETREFVRAAEKCGDYFLFQRVFSLWHFAHLPLFFMLVLAAIVHVIAVHLY